MNIHSFKNAVFLLLAGCLLAGCTYHGRIKRNVYRALDLPEKIDANVMVVSDKYIDSPFYLDDPSFSFTRFKIRTDDGVAVAAADALGTLFTEVEVNPSRFRRNYDYVAEVEYSSNASYVRDPQANRLMEEALFQHLLGSQNRFLWVRKIYYPYIITNIRLTLRKPDTRQAVAVYNARSAVKMELGVWAVTTEFLTTFSLGILAPVTGPLYAQAAGHDLRKELEQGLQLSLASIMDGMAQDYALLMEEEPQKTTARQDEIYRDLMKKTVFLRDHDSLGSGFFISPDGYIVTNAHVADNNRDMEVMTYDDYLAQERGEQVTKRYAKVLLINKRRDLALLKTEGTFPYFELETDRSQYQTGSEVAAIGAPLGHKWSVSKGIISASRSKLSIRTEAGPSEEPNADYIQTDAAINHGNSGGPLILLKTGKVIGVNSIGEFLENAEALGFAISAFEVKRTLGVTQPVKSQEIENRLIKRKTTLGNVIVD